MGEEKVNCLGCVGRSLVSPRLTPRMARCRCLARIKVEWIPYLDVFELVFQQVFLVEEQDDWNFLERGLFEDLLEKPDRLFGSVIGSRFLQRLVELGEGSDEDHARHVIEQRKPLFSDEFYEVFG